VSNLDVMGLHKKVWVWRREVEEFFPTPTSLDCIDFAFTEAAEALDADIRKNAGYKRNSQKAHSIEQELTQCALMLLSAIPWHWNSRASDFYYTSMLTWTVRSICIRLGQCLETHRNYHFLLATVCAIATLVNLETQLPIEMKLLADKHRPITSADDHPMSQNEVANEHVIYPMKSEGLTLTDYVEGCTQ